MPVVFISLGAIVVLYFLFALSPSFLSKRVCAICAAVSLTWIGLLVGYLLKWHNNMLIIGILMGGSVVGIMYRTERYFQKKLLANFWLVRLLIIVFGFLGVYLTLTEQWNTLITVAVLAVIIGFLTLFFIKEQKTVAIVGEEQKKTLKEKMEHCCD